MKSQLLVSHQIDIMITKCPMIMRDSEKLEVSQCANKTDTLNQVMMIQLISTMIQMIALMRVQN